MPNFANNLDRVSWLHVYTHSDFSIQAENSEEKVVTRSNFNYMFWNIAQHLTHLSVNGCPINAGDMLGSGTISDPTPKYYGSMLELGWKGEKPIKLNNE